MSELDVLRELYARMQTIARKGMWPELLEECFYEALRYAEHQLSKVIEDADGQGRPQGA